MNLADIWKELQEDNFSKIPNIINPGINMDGIYDVAVIGGGPAGSTVATLLSQAQRRVILIEKEKFPRFHIGESLLPFSMDALERMGVMPKIKQAGFVPKHGAEITSGCGKREVRFYFKDGFRSKRQTAFQVLRSEFDKILLDHASECGADIHEEASVSDIAFDQKQATLTYTQGGNEKKVGAKYVVDCSGRHSVLGTKFHLKQEYANLRKVAVYAHYDNVRQPDGIEGTFTRMVRTRDHWFWMIPLSQSKVSVGVVMDVGLFREKKSTPELILEQSIESLPVMRERLQGSVRSTKVYTSGDYSYRNLNMHGKQWLLAGDAAGFIDPIFSSGVFLAIHSGERAADALNTVLDDPTKAEATFFRYSKRLSKVMNLYLRFVQAWYQQEEFVETLLNPTEFFQVVPAVNAVLAGNLGNSFSLRWRLWLFHAIVKLQRVVPISPKIALMP